MTPDSRTTSILRRKARGADPVSDVDVASTPVEPPGRDRASRALRRAIARAGQNEMALALEASDITVHDEASLAEVLDMPEARSLLAILEGPTDGLGLFALAPDVLDGVLQQQTTGSVFPSATPPRCPTRTDAAMSAGLIDRILAELEAGLAETPDLAWAGGYRYASFLDEPRTLGLLLEDIAYRVFRIDVELDAGVRRGSILLALPADGAPAPARASDGAIADAAAATADTEVQWQEAITQAVMTSPAMLHAVLERLRLPLGQVLNWQPGDIIALPMARLDGVSLDGPGSRGLAHGRLGRSRGFRAVRLNATTIEDAAGADTPARASTRAASSAPDGAEPVPAGDGDDVPAPAPLATAPPDAVPAAAGQG